MKSEGGLIFGMARRVMSLYSKDAKKHAQHKGNSSVTSLLKATSSRQQQGGC
jgi:hypothetical protein